MERYPKNTHTKRRREESPLLDTIDPALLMKKPKTDHEISLMDLPYASPTPTVNTSKIELNIGQSFMALSSTGPTGVNEVDYIRGLVKKPELETDTDLMTFLYTGLDSLEASNLRFNPGDMDDTDSTPGPEDITIDLAAINRNTRRPSTGPAPNPLSPANWKVHFGDEKILAERLWATMLIQNVDGIKDLVKEGATPMTSTQFGGHAIDMAVRMENAAMVRALLPNRDALRKYGHRALLVAVNNNSMEMMTALLNMGMRELLAADETAKIIVYGHTCKHGTPEMIDTLSAQGPWFSWKAYWHWCLRLSDQTKKGANGNKVWELKEEYMEREMNKRPLMNRNDVIDTWHEAQELPALHQVMRIHCNANPNNNIDDLYWTEYYNPTKYLNPVKRAPAEYVRRRTGFWDM
ncbi:uncharacterized protein DSM5745_08823 [Aspergillus mulundensis]|uniref:Ankyrin repeat protein n=1 Tax=Aspergillus mulundensis TaxID=1810919 RepID=A0A3D8R4T2_9EURO|nr:hypothetical protein DSM5745_08823 [Aspergillus mulundensis]RDW69063.1 hypothetical protein DSM5745_08823 [Aspergillus mulundensis]